MPKGNKHPALATADNPNLMQNKYKEVAKHKDKIKQALSNSMTFAGDFVFDKNNPDVISSITTIQNPEECAERLNWFFQVCRDTGQLPTIEKMYLSLGIYKRKAYWWNYSGKKPEITMMIDKAKSIISAMDAELASTGTLSPVVYIFRSKNFYGMRDQVDIQASSTNSLEESHNIIEDKYKDVITVNANVRDSATSEINSITTQDSSSLNDTLNDALNDSASSQILDEITLFD